MIGPAVTPEGNPDTVPAALKMYFGHLGCVVNCDFIDRWSR